MLRRQLSKEQRDAVMVDMRQDGMSYRQIAETVGVSAPTVMATVKNLTVEQPAFINGKDGKRRDAQQQPKPEPPISMFVPGSTVVIDHVAAESQVKQARQELRLARTRVGPR